MLPIQKCTLLRRSDAAFLNTSNLTTEINVDEEERRQARKTIVQEASSIEENETLKSCLQIYQQNKLSKKNAWSVSLIDTLSALLGKHHKTIKNFKVAGSTLEASSKVYGLRVDSVHMDALRMCSGLKTQKFTEEEENNEGLGHQDAETQKDIEEEAKIKTKKKRRKLLLTITKNKETINAPLDTHSVIDPLFAKLNSLSGISNSSNRLLLNCLTSVDSELQRKTNAPFWDTKSFMGISYLDEYDYLEVKAVDVAILTTIETDCLVLRSHYTGYVITNTPAEQDLHKNKAKIDFTKSEEDAFGEENNNSQLAVAFDINADLEPLPPDIQPYIDVDTDNFEELNLDEQTAITNCKGLRKAPIVIEDLRPLDSASSKLEYSYRPLNNISQFWAGPSHWKFKASKNKSSLSLAQRFSSQTERAKTLQQFTRTKKSVKYRTEQVPFGEIHDNLYKKLNNCKTKKMNVRKWDARKLKLPADLKVEQNIFDVYKYAPGIFVHMEGKLSKTQATSQSDDFNYDQAGQDFFEPEPNNNYAFENFEQDPQLPGSDEQVMDHTSLEIANDFAGAPDKVIQIIVPFAKRAKVVDMKQLKKCCMLSIKSQFEKTSTKSVHLLEFESDKYVKGVATFSQTYKSLPKILTENMAEALSPSVALYSILHLANESNLRLISQVNLSDFKICQLNLSIR